MPEHYLSSQLEKNLDASNRSQEQYGDVPNGNLKLVFAFGIENIGLNSSARSERLRGAIANTRSVACSIHSVYHRPHINISVPPIDRYNGCLSLLSVDGGNS